MAASHQVGGEHARLDPRAAREIQVNGISEQGVPVQYRTMVDLETGWVWMRQNEVKHVGKPKSPTLTEGRDPWDLLRWPK